jgi:hypothetical protein
VGPGSPVYTASPKMMRNRHGLPGDGEPPAAAPGASA